MIYLDYFIESFQSPREACTIMVPTSQVRKLRPSRTEHADQDYIAECLVSVLPAGLHTSVCLPVTYKEEELGPLDAESISSGDSRSDAADDSG